TTSFVVYLVCCVTALYTKVVRFSFNQRSRRRLFFPGRETTAREKSLRLRRKLFSLDPTVDSEPPGY
ncbi:MAG: hypothetical protein WBH05_08505, partial [Syntrophobacteria bacterium]